MNWSIVGRTLGTITTAGHRMPTVATPCGDSVWKKNIHPVRRPEQFREKSSACGAAWFGSARVTRRFSKMQASGPLKLKADSPRAEMGKTPGLGRMAEGAPPFWEGGLVLPGVSARTFSG